MQSNFFLVRGGLALTPPLEAGILEGVTRNFVFEVGASAGIVVREQTLLPADLATAGGPAGKLSRNLLEPSVTPVHRSVVAEKLRNHVHVPDRSLRDPSAHLVVPTRRWSKQALSRSIAQSTLSRRSATERKARACPWPWARGRAGG